MPERSNLSFEKLTSGPFFRRSPSACTSIRLSDYCGSQLYRLIELRGSMTNDDKSMEYPGSENKSSGESQQKLRAELQGILKRAHEASLARKQSA
jgi:hypothetical protein